MIQVSVYSSFTDLNPKVCQLSNVIERIRADEGLKDRIEQIRIAVAAGDDPLVDALKRALPHFTASGIFRGRRKRKNLVGYTGIIQADADNLTPERVDEIEKQAKGDQHVISGFRSPKGFGYKMLILTAAETPTVNAVAFRTVQAYVRAVYGFEIDPACRDTSRACFAGSDPNAFYRDDAVPLALIDGLSDTSDIGRAQKFLDRFYPVLRFVPPWRRWLVFMDGRWQGDGDGAEYRLIEKVWLPELMAEKERSLDRVDNEPDWDPTMAADWWKDQNQPQQPAPPLNPDDEEKRKKRLKKIIEMATAKYTNNDPLKQMLTAASRSADVIIGPDQVDSNPMLVGVKNGYIDLETGAFEPYNSDVVITKSMNVVYNASSKCPRWEQFMREVLPNKRVRAFVTKAMGNCLTGRLNKAIMFLWGTGDNGKSVFLDVLSIVFGDYACRTSPQLLYKSKYLDSVPPYEKAELFGKRLAVGNEVAQDAKLNEAAIKEVTGEALTTGCRKYENPFTFQQTAKLWIAGNHSPVVKGTDDAIWGRINKVEFPAKFDKTQNTDIRERLLEEAPGILNWLIRAARHCLEHGNPPPKEVTLAVEEYRNEEDVLKEFIEEYFMDGQFVEVVHVYEAYKKWSEKTGGYTFTRRQLVRQLKERGFIYGRDTTGDRRGFRDVQLNPASYTP